jgi:hypothetical protein
VFGWYLFSSLLFIHYPTPSCSNRVHLFRV